MQVTRAAMLALSIILGNSNAPAALLALLVCPLRQEAAHPLVKKVQDFHDSNSGRAPQRKQPMDCTGPHQWLFCCLSGFRLVMQCQSSHPSRSVTLRPTKPVCIHQRSFQYGRRAPRGFRFPPSSPCTLVRDSAACFPRPWVGRRNHSQSCQELAQQLQVCCLVQEPPVQDVPLWTATNCTDCPRSVCSRPSRKSGQNHSAALAGVVGSSPRVSCCSASGFHPQ
mmetsp:Transcript_65822/g.152944  ORF Transcript_65822/g.152944 Transcript_65822/m.152944 type:complete len:224 (+) Transcript_65822:292-963(+)